MEMIRYGEKISGCTILGPGSRAVLWVHGCCFDCPGCIAQSYRHGPYQQMTAQEAADWYLSLPDAGGLTISGGEPMLQAGPLADMVDGIRREKDMGLIVYTGFRLEELQAKQDAQIDRFLSLIDLLIDGRYEQELDHNQPYRGSANQRLLTLTDRYQAEVETYYGTDAGRQIELRVTGSSVLLVGVPGRDQVQLWQSLKRKGDTRNGASY